MASANEVLSLLTVPNVTSAVYADFLFSIAPPKVPLAWVVVPMRGATVEQVAFGTLILLCLTEPNESAFQLDSLPQPMLIHMPVGLPQKSAATKENAYEGRRN